MAKQLHVRSPYKKDHVQVPFIFHEKDENCAIIKPGYNLMRPTLIWNDWLQQALTKTVVSATNSHCFKNQHPSKIQLSQSKSYLRYRNHHCWLTIPSMRVIMIPTTSLHQVGSYESIAASDTMGFRYYQPSCICRKNMLTLNPMANPNCFNNQQMDQHTKSGCGKEIMRSCLVVAFKKTQILYTHE